MRMQRIWVQDNPVHSMCVNGDRFIPVKLIDITGLVPELIPAGVLETNSWMMQDKQMHLFM